MKPDKADMPTVCGRSAGQVFTGAVNKSGLNVEKPVEKVEKSCVKGIFLAGLGVLRYNKTGKSGVRKRK